MGGSIQGIIKPRPKRTVNFKPRKRIKTPSYSEIYEVSSQHVLKIIEGPNHS